MLSYTWFTICCVFFKSIWWRHLMEIFSALLALCAGNSPVTGEFPHKSQWRGALMFSLICAWTNGWVKNRDAGDLRRHRAHYDVTAMIYLYVTSLGSGKSYDCPIQFLWSNPEEYAKYITRICSALRSLQQNKRQQGMFRLWILYHSRTSSHRKRRVLIMSTLSTLAAPAVVITTTSSTTNKDKVGIMTLGFRCSIDLSRWQPNHDYFCKRFPENGGWRGCCCNLSLERQHEDL